MVRILRGNPASTFTNERWEKQVRKHFVVFVILGVLLVAVPARAQIVDGPVFVWGAEPQAIVTVDTCMLSTPQDNTDHLFCEMDEVVQNGFGTVMIGFDRDGFRLFVRVFESAAFAAADVYPGVVDGTGRRDDVATREDRPEHGLPYDASITCALYDDSFITHECVLNYALFPATRFFLGDHSSYLYVSARVVGHGWAAAWIDNAGIYGFNGQLTSLP